MMVPCVVLMVLLLLLRVLQVLRVLVLLLRVLLLVLVVLMPLALVHHLLQGPGLGCRPACHLGDRCTWHTLVLMPGCC